MDDAFLGSGRRTSHELREVADDLGRGYDLNDVASTELVRLDEILLDLRLLSAETKLLCLEL